MLIAAVLVAFSVTSASPPSAEPDPLGIVWKSRGVSLVRVACKPGDVDERYCRALQLRTSGRSATIGAGYMHVRLLWTRRGRSLGPDALVLGEDGGSGGSGDLIAVTLGPTPAVKKYTSELLEGLRANPGAAELRLELPFAIGYFNGAPHAGVTVVPIPTLWARGDFRADIGALVRPNISRQELDFRELAMRQELHAWSVAKYPTARLYPPEAESGTPITLQALADLTLTGHSDEAKALLDRAWPNSWERSDVKLGGELEFWKSFCRTVLRNPLWLRLGLERLPHSETIRAGAA